MSEPKALWVQPDLSTGIRAAVMHDVERVPQANLPERTHLRVQDGLPRDAVSIRRFNGAITRSVVVQEARVSVDMRNGPAVPRYRTDVAQTHVQAESPEVAEAVRSAIDRAYADSRFSPAEALALERLRQSVAGALQDDGRFDAQELRSIGQRAAAVAPRR